MIKHTKAHALEAITYWHNVCSRYNAGNASGIDMRMAHQDALRALSRAEASGFDVSDLRTAHRLEA